MERDPRAREGAEAGETHLEGAVVPLQLPAQALQLAPGQDGLAVLALQVILLLHQLALLLLQDLHLLLGIPVLFQLGKGSRGLGWSRAELGPAEGTRARCAPRTGVV